MGTIKEDKGMTLIVKTVTRITLPFILLFGIYLTLKGHISPGGGFVGGLLIALAFIHIMLAFGKEVALRKLRAYMLRFTVSVAALIFLYIIMSGWHTKYLQFVMPLCEMAIVASAVFAIFVALVLLSKSDRYSQ